MSLCGSLILHANKLCLSIFILQKLPTEQNLRSCLVSENSLLRLLCTLFIELYVVTKSENKEQFSETKWCLILSLILLGRNKLMCVLSVLHNV